MAGQVIKARRLPVDVEVMHHDGDQLTAEAIALWLFEGGMMAQVRDGWVHFGIASAKPGDYVVKHSYGNFRVVSPELFRMSYEVL